MSDFSLKKREELRLRFLHVDTSNVADVLDTLDYRDQGLSPDFVPYPQTAGRIAGWAYTIRGQMTPGELGGDAEKMRACQGISNGEIGVWSGNGEGICYFGELIAIGKFPFSGKSCKIAAISLKGLVFIFRVGISYTLCSPYLPHGRKYLIGRCAVFLQKV